MKATIKVSIFVCKQMWVLLLVFVLLQFHFSPSFSAFLPESQALLSLKSSISDDPHSSLSSWNSAAVAAHCTWFGVTCDSRRHVVALHLSSLDLTGTLSPDLASLRFLTNVSFGLNKFYGGIPPEFASISSLQYLNLSSNILNGSIPSEFSQLKNLQVLDVYNNNLTGDFPIVVTEMPNLRYLHLGGNFFTGQIPPAVGRLQFLEVLKIHGNDLEGSIPPAIGNLTKLRELFIGYYNTFVGGLPATIGNLSELVRLDAASCGLSGKFPPELGKLQNLTILYLQQNALSGPLPELGMKSIKELDISCNMLVGEIPTSFSKFKNLRLLQLFDNKLSGEIPEFMGDLPKLEILQLWNNNFTGSIPRNLGKNGMLQILDLAFNHLTGTVPSQICHGNKLEVLIAMDNSLSGSIPESLGNCISLKRILLWGNALNGTIPKNLLGLPNLTQIDFHDNFLSGELPITNLVSANLLQISLSNNMLSGSLPPNIGSLVAVQKLLLDRNKFSGQIPSNIGRLQQLSRINFSQNEFSGTIVPEISECKHLIFLDLSRNELSGEIPNHITNMKLLNYMNLSRNHLVGSIPASIVNMQSLTSVDFSYNNLSGLVLGTGQFGYFNYTSFLGNPYLCGAYLGPCKDGVLPSNYQEHVKGSLSTPLRLLLVFGFFFCLVAVTFALILKVRWFKRERESRGWRLTAFQRFGFSVDEILDCLKKENLIAKGGYGSTVYTGVMPSGDQITVKRLPKISNGCSRDNGFDAEIQALGRIRHRHIVRLLGLCSNHETNLLVFEYMPNGSLYEVLHGKKGGHLLWETRYKIAIGTANGLCYLHHHCSPPIVHRNVKSNNIMLDTNFDAQIANSGLAKFLQDSGTSDTSAIEQERAYSQDVDEKWDVYSFGVVLLELISGRNLVLELSDSVNIDQWVRNMTHSKKEGIHKIVDQRLSSAPLDEVMHVINVAMLCTEAEAAKRPTMQEVVRILTEHQQQSFSKEDRDTRS